MNIAFTGHRDFDPSLLKRPLVEYLIDICSRFDEQVVFWCGMAVGFDIAAGEAVVEARRRGADVRLLCVIPFVGHDLNLGARSRSRYNALLKECDGAFTLAESYHSSVFHRRNDYLIEQADLLIAFLDTTKKGGTAYTVRHATKLKKPVINLFPQQQLSLWSE